MSVSVEDSILYEVKGKTAIITLNLPKVFNALAFEHYQRLDELVQKAAKDPNTVVTLIQSTGKFFSAGANVSGAGQRPTGDYVEMRRNYIAGFGARNLSITETFYNHPKVLVVALNGPVIGLSAALVALADFIYAVDSTFLLTPFANIGLVAEGASSYTLLQRLGWSKASEALLASRPIDAKTLADRGFINELFKKSDFKSVEEFNAKVLSIIENSFSHLDHDSVKDIKQLLLLSMRSNLQVANSTEVIGGIEKFSLGIPQKRFAALAAKKLKHKL
ncbi:dodecenoyl-CoA isomerase [Sugiyamaella lignohabitans]|uniref:Dodecenoyl-CoA isomerase n=1 Tax=Sugiyamaella lignohabitans TaxID=796027 RepID=A0A167EN94_9ASCO|nr:dodecenoyl-CoA isomerase [Sugiyamaella lignohabitans]ANB14273.1 dodecenoyl-CoA isomerase [Sugiyamaella lignohabitans]